MTQLENAKKINSPWTRKGVHTSLKEKKMNLCQTTVLELTNVNSNQINNAKESKSPCLP